MTPDREVDVLVIGAGGAGMTAALVAATEGLRVLLCEKTELVGGTTATSGGAIWVPGTTQSKRTPTPDSVDAARVYLDGEAGAYGAASLREAFYAAGATAIDYLEQKSEVKFRASSPYPDYHPEAPGGAQGGRSLSPLPFDARRLGRDFATVRPPIPEFLVLGGMMVARAEIPHLVRPLRSVAALRTTLRLLGRHARDRLSHPRGTRLVLGNALIARLLYSLKKAGAELWTQAALVDLVKEGDRVVGARVRHAGRDQLIAARRGVVLATGGCGASPKWREQLLGHPVPHTLTFPGCTGEGLDAALRIGAALDTQHANPFFWMPASTMRWPDGRVATYPHIRDRPKPGLIAVNAAGRRFVNEANSYQDFVMAMYASNASVPTIPAWLICDRRFIYDYGLGVIHPRKWSIARFVKSGYLVQGRTLRELAQKIGVDADGLEATVATHNRDAATGVDTAFGKGSTALNRYNGDAENKPNPCLRPIRTAPFFALAVNPAPIGSSAGLASDVEGRVLDAQGRVIDGLYACGNDMSSVMRGTYPGPGITLGPALVFAWRIAMHAAGRPAPATVAGPAAAGRTTPTATKETSL